MGADTCGPASRSGRRMRSIQLPTSPVCHAFAGIGRYDAEPSLQCWWGKWGGVPQRGWHWWRERWTHFIGCHHCHPIRGSGGRSSTTYHRYNHRSPGCNRGSIRDCACNDSTLSRPVRVCVPSPAKHYIQLRWSVRRGGGGRGLPLTSSNQTAGSWGPGSLWPQRGRHARFVVARGMDDWLQLNASAVTTGTFGNTAPPSFPELDGRLQRNAFKAVIGSWARGNPDTTDTNDFEVNVSSYVPKQAFVTRAVLSGVDIPTAQQLIEPAWCRLYYTAGGLRVSPTCRSLRVTACLEPGGGVRPHSCVARVTLPLPMDRVVGLQPLSHGVTRLTLENPVPAPIQAVGDTWRWLEMNAGGMFAVVGLPGTTGPVSLAASALRPDTSLSFDVLDNGFYATAAAAVSAGPLPSMYLVASSLPTPVVLARALTGLVAAAGDASLGRLSFQYSDRTDGFTAVVPASAAGTRWTLDGPLAEYMGFGLSLTFQGASVGPRMRLAAPAGFAGMRSGSPMSPDALAAWVQFGFNAFVWPGFAFGLVLPTLPRAVTVLTAAGGCTDFHGLAAQMTAACVSAGYPYSSVVVTAGGAGGVEFRSTTGLVFAVDWSVDGSFDALRVGFPRVQTPFGRGHAPNLQPDHVPVMEPMCGPLSCTSTDSFTPVNQVRVVLDPTTARPQIVPIPLPVFSAATVSLDTTTGEVTVTAADGYVPGMVLGAGAVLCDATTSTQVRVLVSGVRSPSGFTAVLWNPADAAVFGSPVFASGAVVAPTDAGPLCLYLQANGQVWGGSVGGRACPRDAPLTWQKSQCFTAALLGLAPATVYGTAGSEWAICAHGTVRVCQDPYVVICLAFSGGSTIPTVGDVYYPFPGGGSQVVFAKVGRNSLFRSDFESFFEHAFPGAGTHIGIIRVQILNVDGTLYETHGHPVSLTLRFDCMESGLSWGEGRAALLRPDTEGTAPLPIARGTYFPHGTGS